MRGAAALARRAVACAFYARGRPRAGAPALGARSTGESEIEKCLTPRKFWPGPCNSKTGGPETRDLWARWPAQGLVRMMEWTLFHGSRLIMASCCPGSCRRCFMRGTATSAWKSRRYGLPPQPGGGGLLIEHQEMSGCVVQNLRHIVRHFGYNSQVALRGTVGRRAALFPVS